jgi:RNA polymerase sigma-70 factor (ECF subfamily)
MNWSMNENERDVRTLIERAANGDEAALSELMDLHRSRLKKMIRVRLNRQLHGRVDDSDIVQDAYLEAARRLPDYLKDPQAPFFLWLRRITFQRLIDVHRRHLGTRARDARLEIALYRGRLPRVSSMSLAAQLVGRLTSPSVAVANAEARLALQEGLNQMDDMDREILSLRHFEQLSNVEAAQELEIEPKTASKRYTRSLGRLKKILEELGFVE